MSKRKKQSPPQPQPIGIQEPHSVVINQYTSNIQIVPLESGDSRGIPVEMVDSGFSKFGPDFRLLIIKTVNRCSLVDIK